LVSDDRLPDARDGLTRLQRVILWQLGELSRERDGGNVPSAELYGRVVEHVNVSVEEFQAVLAQMVAQRR
jgi:DNA gyrase/topoisomerase IV subunit A